MSTKPTVSMRLLGRSKQYSINNLPKRLNQWHAPRANRWEYLLINQGQMKIEWLQADQVRQQTLALDQPYWIAPGTRWRVVWLNAQTRFELEIYADNTTQPAAPQHSRTHWFDSFTRIEFNDPAELKNWLASAHIGHFLCSQGFDPSALIKQKIIATQGRVSWHPLYQDAQVNHYLLIYSQTPMGLQEYLGRDHAAIEAALAGELTGLAEQAGWLEHTLKRHLYIEEALIFPAYLDAGGPRGWVNGLKKEHEHLRYHLPRLADASSQRKFLLLLDGHDEKEEQTVYPDVVQALLKKDISYKKSLLETVLTTGFYQALAKLA